ncbi:hypothetical protein CWI84_05190 [Idiomarina tyrosinivorans]|uniref:Uncharacterized protein n=1 Tax=Idiomarina tyrosinivorans TaxID=1445662 RepID=A0A432ZRC4_9GAMM|nr:hypothetical protein [Idiomarina tyrosinivorans]RUO80457.1 hypothetical protein CWI84_05190 [Idiomarina tyrosinivorans]
MTNILDAFIFAVLVASGCLGLTSLLMFFFHKNPEDAEAQQRERVEYSFFGLAGIIIMLVAWYAIA